MELDSITLKYHLEDSIVENELDLFGEDTTQLHGIRRFNVFWFDESINMLLPVETFHDEENNLVYASMDRDGIFCLMDMEKWLYSLAEQTEYGAESVAYAMEDGLPDAVSENEEKTIQNVSEKRDYETFDFNALSDMPSVYSMQETDDRPVDIMFIVQSEGNDRASFERSFGTVMMTLFYLSNDYSNVRFTFMEQNLDGLYGEGVQNRPVWYDESQLMDEFMDSICDMEYHYSTGNITRGG